MAAATVTITQISKMPLSSSLCSPIRRSKGIIEWTMRGLKRSTVGVQIVRAEQPQNDDLAAFISQEDLKYFVKLGGGSLLGAAAIKYGSIILPEITTPNILQALIMIFAPVFVAIALLFINQSRRVD